MGFAVLDEQVERVRKATLKSSLEKYVGDALRPNKDTIADYNRQQLLRGMDTEVRTLGQYARFTYKNRWKPVDLKLTGDFHRSIKAKFNPTSVELVATDPKTDELKARYGAEILGLTLEDIWELGDDIKGQVQYGMRREAL